MLYIKQVIIWLSGVIHMAYYRKKYNGGHNRIMNNLWLRRTRLINMMYTSSELAEELNLDRAYITQDLVKLFDLPCEKDDHGRLWFNGSDVRKWIENSHKVSQEKKQNKQPYAENEFYCLRCKKRVFTDKSEVIVPSGGSHFMQMAYCPECGMKMHKILKEFVKNG